MTDKPIGEQLVRLTPNESPEKVDAQTRTFTLSDSSVALDGHTLATRGWDLTRAKDNLPVLWAHDSDTVESVLGQWRNLRIEGDALIGDAVFMPRDINPTAGMVLDMIDGGWLRMCSVGFVPTDGKPSNRGPGQYDFTAQTLLEASIVPVGSLASALISARDAGIDISPASKWAKRITESFMAENEPKPAEPVDSPAEISASVAETRDSPKMTKRGLYAVANLAYLLEELGYLAACSQSEADREGDGSAVPGMLLDSLKSLGAALVAMTAEEVSELIGGDDDDDMSPMALLMSADVETRKAITTALRDAAAGKQVTLTTSIGSAAVRAGKSISKDTLNTLNTAHDHMCRAVEAVKGLIDKASDRDDTGEIETMSALRARKLRLAIARSNTKLTG